MKYTMQGNHSIAKEFELYCGKKYILGLIASLFFIGRDVDYNKFDRSEFRGDSVSNTG